MSWYDDHDSHPSFIHQDTPPRQVIPVGPATEQIQHLVLTTAAEVAHLGLSPEEIWARLWDDGYLIDRAQVYGTLQGMAVRS